MTEKTLQALLKKYRVARWCPDWKGSLIEKALRKLENEICRAAKITPKDISGRTVVGYLEL